MATWKQLPILLFGTAMAMLVAGQPEDAKVYTGEFDIDGTGVLMPDASNRYFPLEPGRFLRYEGTDDEGRFVEIEHTVLHEIRVVLFEMNGQPVIAIARVVEEREWVDGELSELTTNFFARAPDSNDVFYLGEEVEIFEEGQRVSQDGSWLAGQKGALPGLIMPGSFLVGSRYYQEMAPGVAMDRAEHVAAGLEVSTPAGVFENCVMVTETTPIEPDEETIKIYAPGIGVIVDDFVQLVEIQ